MFPSKKESALLILGHGSTENPDSSHPTWVLADSISQMECFSSVHCAFWKEEPSFRQVFAAIDEQQVYVVPNFISEGYFTREVIPRELGLGAGTLFRGGQLIHYCEPVGIHPAMTDLLAQRALEMIGDAVEASDIALIIVGHGTKLNRQSTEAITLQVERLKQAHYPFGEVIDAYMEEAPFISDWRILTDAENVVVVPFFIADGLHSYQDIPGMLGIESDTAVMDGKKFNFPGNFHRIDGRSLFYSRAIGTDPMMMKVVLDQVAKFDETQSNAAV